MRDESQIYNQLRNGLQDVFLGFKATAAMNIDMCVCSIIDGMCIVLAGIRLLVQD